MSDADALLLVLVALAISVAALLSASKRTEKQQEQADVTTPQRKTGGVQIENLRRARVEKILDGDTVIVSLFWQSLRIRLASIDCPEDGQYWGDTAKYGLIKLIGGRSVHIEEHGLDHHGRTLATIYVQHEEKWINVNERMVTLGHAWVVRKYCDHLPQRRKDQLIRLEKWARSKRVGLWKAANPIPPWKWRKGE